MNVEQNMNVTAYLKLLGYMDTVISSFVTSKIPTGLRQVESYLIRNFSYEVGISQDSIILHLF